MPVTLFDFNFDIKSAKRDIKGVIKRLSYQQAGWRAVGPFVVEKIKENFEQQGNIPNKWVPRKNEENYAWPMLYKSGKLYDSVTFRVERRGLWAVAKTVYAARQNWGFSGIDKLGRRVFQPGRPFFSLWEGAIRAISTRMNRWYLTGEYNW